MLIIYAGEVRTSMREDRNSQSIQQELTCRFSIQVMNQLSSTCSGERSSTSRIIGALMGMDSPLANPFRIFAEENSHQLGYLRLQSGRYTENDEKTGNRLHEVCTSQVVSKTRTDNCVHLLIEGVVFLKRVRWAFPSFLKCKSAGQYGITSALLTEWNGQRTCLAQLPTDLSNFLSTERTGKTSTLIHKHQNGTRAG